MTARQLNLMFRYIGLRFRMLDKRSDPQYDDMMNEMLDVIKELEESVRD